MKITLELKHRPLLQAGEEITIITIDEPDTHDISLTDLVDRFIQLARGAGFYGVREAFGQGDE